MALTSTGAPARLRDYLSLSKPRVVLLHLITAATAMVLAAGGAPGLRALLLTIAGGALTTGGANALNCYLDRDLDRMMDRTSQRPLPQRRLAPWQALAFAIAVAAAGLVVLALVDVRAAGIAAVALLYYVVVYTLWLKRSTPLSTVAGSVSGALPPLVGWVAVTGTVGPAAVLLAAIIFLWTPPHFWALALARRDDYLRAGVPVVPVVSPDTPRRVFVWSLLLVPSTLLLGPVAGTGAPYYIGAALLGAWFVLLAAGLLRRRPGAAPALYRYSVVYLALLFAVMVVDRLA